MAFYARCKPEERPSLFKNAGAEALAPSASSSDRDDSSQTVEDEKVQNEKAAHSDSEKDIEALAEERGIPMDSAEPIAPNKSGTQAVKDDKKYDGSLLMALHSTYFWRWWSAGILYCLSRAC